MAYTYTLKLSPDLDSFKKFNADYAEGLRIQFENLQKVLNDLKDPATSAFSSSVVTNAVSKIDNLKLDQLKYDMFHFPEQTWDKKRYRPFIGSFVNSTTRSINRNILVDKPYHVKAGDKDAYSEISSVLKEAESSLGWFASFDKDKAEVKKELEQAQAKLKKFQRNANMEFLRLAKNELAKKLHLKLSNYPSTYGLLKPSEEDLFHKTIKYLEELSLLDSLSLKNRENCLKIHKNSSLLRDNLKNFADKLSLNGSEFDEERRELAVITQKWVDFHYDKPSEYTLTDKVRSVVKIVCVSVAILLAISAIVCAFVFPPLSGILGLASLIGLAPVVDTVGEMVRNAWYNRVPTKALFGEIGFVVAFMGTLVGITQGLGIAAAAGAAVGVQVAAKVFGSYVMNGVATAINSFFGPLLVKQHYNQTGKPKNADETKNHNYVRLSRAVKVMKSELEGKTKNSEHAILKLRSKLSNAKNGRGYLYSKDDVDSSGNKIYKLKFKPSYSKDIAEYGHGFFSTGTTNEAASIQKHVDEYKDLSSTANLAYRIEVLDKLIRSITEWKKLDNNRRRDSSRRGEHVEKLEKFCKEEKRTLQSLEKKYDVGSVSDSNCEREPHRLIAVK